MKQLIYTLAITLFLALVTGCGGSSTPPQEGTISVQSPINNPNEGDTSDTIEQLPTDPQNEETTLENEESVPAMKLYADPAIDEIFLRWIAVDNATGYELEWGERDDILENRVTFNTDQIQYLHQDLEPETIYYYRITVKYTGTISAKPSTIVAVKTKSIAQVMQSDLGY